MHYQLDAKQKAAWKARVQSQRERVGKKPKDWAGVEGFSTTPISRFESGDEVILKSWFGSDKADRWAVDIGVAGATLRGWLNEILGLEPAPRSWHPDFPGVTLQEARIWPPLRVSTLLGGLPAGSESPGSLEELIALGDVSHPRRVRLATSRAAGSTALLSWWKEAAWPAHLSLDESDGSDRSGRQVAGTGDVLTVELLPWDAACVAKLADRLVELEALDEVERRHVENMIARMRASSLSVGPSTAIGLISRHRKPSGGGRDILLDVADALWQPVQSQGGMELIDAGWMLAFWAQRRLDCAGETWVNPTRDEAVASMQAVVEKAGGGPLNRTRLLEQLTIVASGTSRKEALEAMRRELAIPDAEEVVDAMVAANLLSPVQSWLTAADPRLAEGFAAEGLRARLSEIAADDTLAWALDPSWQRVLVRLGTTGVDLLPLVDRWRGEPSLVRAEGALALVHLLSRATVGHSERMIAAVREVQAAAMWVFLSSPPREWHLFPLLWLAGDRLREPVAAFQALSETWSEVLGFFGADPLGDLGARVPEDLRMSFTASAGPFAAIMPFNSDIPREEYAAIAVVCLAPWQCPPVESVDSSRWWNASSISGFATGRLVDPHLVVEMAHEHGHPTALSALAGDRRAEPDASDGGEPAAEVELGTVRRHDPWRSLPWDVRCRWVGCAGSMENTVARFVELVEEPLRERDCQPLLDAAARLGAGVITIVVVILATPAPDDGLGWRLGGSAWILHDHRNADLAVRLARAAKAKAALEALDDTVTAHLPLGPRWELPTGRTVRLGTEEPIDGGLADAAALLGELGHIDSRSQPPAWLAPASRVVAKAISWERVRHEAVEALANLGDLDRLRKRGLGGTGWSWPARRTEDLGLVLRLWELAGPRPPRTLTDFTRFPAPADDGMAFLNCLRERGLTRSGVPDDGSHFPPAGGGPRSLGFEYDGPAWLAERIRELRHLPELGDSERGVGVHRSIWVLGWLFTWDHYATPRRADIPDGLWEWLGNVAGGSWLSTAAAVRRAIERRVMADAAAALLARRDGVFLAALYPEVYPEGTAHDPLEPARRSVEALLKVDAPLRRILWATAHCNSVRWSALRAEQAVGERGTVAAWAAAWEAKRRATDAARLLADPDPLQRVAGAIWRPPFEPEEADEVVAAWWTGPEILSVAKRKPFGEDPPAFSASDFYEFVVQRLAAGSLPLRAPARALWEYLHTLPVVVSGESSPDQAADVLPADITPPESWQTALGLVELLPDAEEVLASAWSRSDGVVVGPSMLAATRHAPAYADALDLAAPLLRRDIHRAWLLHAVPTRLPADALRLDDSEPGLVRVLLRERTFRTSAEQVLPWIVVKMGTDDWNTDLWLDWSQIQPAEAWAWLCARLGGADPEHENLMRFAAQVVRLVEGVVPGARRWLLEQRARTWSASSSASGDGGGVP